MSCNYHYVAIADVPLSARNILEDPELKNAVKAFRYVHFYWFYYSCFIREYSISLTVSTIFQNSHLWW